MQIARRDFLQKSLVLALSSMGSACVTTSSGKLFGQGNGEPVRRRDWLGYNPKESDQIEALFTEAVQRKRIPLSFNLPDPDEVDTALSSLEAAKAKYVAKSALSLEEAYGFMQGAVPSLALYAQLPNPNLRGVDTKSKPSISADGVISIPPATLVKFRLKGACLDLTRKAAGKGEKYRFSPSKDFIDPSLYPIYKAVARHEQKLSDVSSSRSSDLCQKAMWTLRDAGTKSPLATHPSPEVLQLIERVHPGGVSRFQRTHAVNQFTNSLIDDLAKQVSFDVNGRRINLADLAHQDRREVTLDNMIKDLYRNPVKAPIPSDNRNFQPLSDTLASYNLGSGELEADVALINNGQTVCTFDPADWVLTASSSVAQRVGLYPNKDTPITFTPLELYLGSDKLAQLEKLKKKLEQEGIDPLARFLINHQLQNIHTNPVFQMWVMRYISPAVAQKLVGSIPLIGNALSAYEFVSGKNWVSGKPLNVYERIGSGFGAVPIAGVAAGIFKAGTFQFLQQTFNIAGMGTNFNAAPKEVLGLANSLKAPMASMDAWTQQQAQTMYQSIEEAINLGKYSDAVVSAFKTGSSNIRGLLYS